MRKSIYPFFLIALLFSACKKNDIPVTGDFHLMKTTGVGGWSGKDEFEYDASGRLIKNTSSENGNAPVPRTVFSYTGNEVAISYPNDDPAHFHRSVIYQLSAQNRPLKRIYSSVLNVNMDFGPDNQFEYDSTNFEYDLNGHLFRQTGALKDSVSYYPSAAGILTIIVEVTTYTVDYEIADGNLKSVKRTAQHNTQIVQGGTYSAQENIEETTVFSYDKGYPNHFDFKNTFLLNEISVLPFESFIPDLSFLNYPNKAVTTTVKKNASGVVTSTETTTDEQNLTFNTNGYLLSNIVDPQTKLVFTYNRF